MYIIFYIFIFCFQISIYYEIKGTDFLILKAKYRKQTRMGMKRQFIQQGFTDLMKKQNV